jgi:hypothetical protein
MWNLFRKIPHPTYGNYGGARKKCESDSCPAPIDWLDYAFMEHDNDLKNMNSAYADKKLGKALRNGKPEKLTFYGKIYLFACKCLFW